jgi:lipopolysaccharide biosynthesis protein/glycosyltransferase involved in cell wall biosynthesis
MTHARYTAEHAALVAASGLFDETLYAADNGDVAGAGINPFEHFMAFGGFEGRAPNAYFSIPDYVEGRPEIGWSGLNPLVYFLIYEPQDARPFRDFDPVWYRRTYPECTEAGQHPLGHYLHGGKDMGCLRHARDIAGPVPAMELRVVFAAPARSNCALFVTHAPEGRIKPHVPRYLDALRHAGLCVTAIVVADDLDTVERAKIAPHCDGLILRENGGYDFAAWAHAADHVDLSGTKLLFISNDSIVGPLEDGAFSTLVDRVRASSAELIGMTDNYELAYHFQSFLFAVKGAGVQRLRAFFAQVAQLHSKQQVIMTYEVRFHDHLKAQGTTTEVLFPAGEVQANRSVLHWRELVESGFPFVKMEALRREPRENWVNVFKTRNYPIEIVDESVRLANLAGGTMPAGGSRKSKGRRIGDSVKYGFYRVMEAATRPFSAKVSSRYAFRAERRRTRRGPSGELREIGLPLVHGSGCAAHDPSRPTILLVSHDASRSGAPILAWNLARTLRATHNVVSLCLSPGELAEAFREHATDTYMAAHLNVGPRAYDSAMRSLLTKHRVDLAIVNSVQCRGVLDTLDRCSVPSVFLVHEFASYIRGGMTYSSALSHATDTVFSSDLTMDSALGLEGVHKTPSMHILPQGKCEVPAQMVLRESRAGPEDSGAMGALLRPEPGGAARVVVMGAGRVEYRKGVDLFIETAARVAANPGMDHVHFVWFGDGYDPDTDLGYSGFLKDQIDRAGLQGRVRLEPPTAEIARAYDLADIFLLPSRLDPLPNVAIDAVCAGLPVLGFAQANGMAGLLDDAGLGDRCVAPYMDTHALADRVVRLAADPEALAALARETRSFAANRFSFPAYAERLCDLGERARKRRLSLSDDIASIAQSDLFDPAFFNPLLAADLTRADCASAYVRQVRTPWAARKPMPGFHPHVYCREAPRGFDDTEDAFAHYLRNGQPEGPWGLRVIRNSGSDTIPVVPGAALHIHAYYTDQLAECVVRLDRNEARPDLFVSVADTTGKSVAEKLLADYGGQVRAIKAFPNAGRDIGPFLTGFGDALCDGYDVVGHIHLKGSPHVENREIVTAWSDFVLDNMLGGDRGGPMLDRILGQFTSDDGLGIVYPDDPHIISWTRNKAAARALAARMGHDKLPDTFNFPVGTMFWIRSAALKPFVDLRLDWDSYPPEPVMIDGTMLHALERLFAVVPALRGWSTAVTHVAGVSR